VSYRLRYFGTIDKFLSSLENKEVRTQIQSEMLVLINTVQHREVEYYQLYRIEVMKMDPIQLKDEINFPQTEVEVTHNSPKRQYF
jgi:hypothetical protein